MSDGGKEFQVSFMQAPCANCPVCCCAGYLCGSCCACYLRKEVLEGDMAQYQCCQGYMGCCSTCWPGQDSCPELCLCLEGCCFPGLAASANRLWLMDQYGLAPDPCDDTLIQISNCCQILACLCHIAAACTDNEDIDQAADCIDCLAQIILCVSWDV
eukprot:UN25859